MPCQVALVLLFLPYILEKFLIKLPQTEDKGTFFQKPIKLVPEKSLKVKDYLVIKLDKPGVINNIAKFFIDNIFPFILLLPKIPIQMQSKSLNLIPYSIELFEIVFQNFILRSFYRKFISRNDNFVNLVILFLPG